MRTPTLADPTTAAGTPDPGGRLLRHIEALAM
jgi:hypothetical protein